MAKRKAKAKAKPAKPRKPAPKKAAPKKRAAKPKPKAKRKPAAEAPRKRSGAGEITRIVGAKEPIGALAKFLGGVKEVATVQQGQIVLGAAQLALVPFAREHRGAPEVGRLIDLVLSRWASLPDRTGFHAQEFLRNAFAAVGSDRDRITQLLALVPHDASAELRFNIACGLAWARQRDAMLRAIETALAAGNTPAQFRRDPDFAAFVDDPAFQAVLARAAPPPIAVDIAPHVPVVRRALDSVIKTLRELGENAKLEPGASLDAVLAAERAAKIQLPNDYRAFLTLCDGMTAWYTVFLGTTDYRHDTKLALRAREFFELSARGGMTGVEDCIPLANLGSPNSWLLYDPRGHVRGGAPGYVELLTADTLELEGLADALEEFERHARDVLGTN